MIGAGASFFGESNDLGKGATTTAVVTLGAKIEFQVLTLGKDIVLYVDFTISRPRG
jgi:hypothetical protein